MAGMVVFGGKKGKFWNQQSGYMVLMSHSMDSHLMNSTNDSVPSFIDVPVCME